MEYIIFLVLMLITQISVWRSFSYETSSVLTASVFIMMLIILFFKTISRRIFFVLMVPSSEYKHTEWVTLSFMFMVLSSVIILLGFMTIGTAGQIIGFPESTVRMIYYCGFFAAFLIPTLISEIAFYQHSVSGLVILYRVAFPIMMMAGLIFPLLYSHDPMMILQLFILTAGIRLLIMLVIMIDLQLIDFFSVTGVRLKDSFRRFMSLIAFDWILWLGIVVCFFLAYISVAVEYQILLVISFSFFFLIPFVMIQISELWSLIFKNFIRLDITGQYIDFVRHLNIWHAVVCFGIGPFLILISHDSVMWLMKGIPESIDRTVLYTSVFFMMICGFFLSNPLKEIIVLLNQKKEILSVIVSSVMGTIVGSYLFTFLLGASGIYFGFLIGSFIYWTGINIIIQPLLACDFKYIFPYSTFLKIMLSSLISSGAGYSMTFIPNPIFNQMGWIFFSYFCLYTVLIVYFGVLKTDNGIGFFNWTRRLGNLH